MTSIFSPDLAVFWSGGTLASTNIHRNIRYGPHTDQRLNVYLNPSRMTNGNPVVVFVHGGAYTDYDKTAQFEGGNRPMFWIPAYSLQSGTFGETTHFDFVSVEYPAWSHGPHSNSASYEPTVTSGWGAQSYRGYGYGFVDDVQRAIQWVHDHPRGLGDTLWSWDVTKVGAMGYSYGAYALMCAALNPSRAYGGNRRWDAQSPADLRFVLNYSGEVSISPWVNHHSITRYLYGMAGAADASATNIRTQMEKLLLVPNSSGSYPSTVDRTVLCKSMSPVDLCSSAPAARKQTKFRHYYDAQDATTSPVTADYSGVPPYGDGGHNKNQRGLIHAAMLSAGIDSTPTDSTWLYDSGSGGSNIQAALEATVVATFDWMEASIA